MALKRCSIDGCEKDAHVRGWCPMHYQRWRKFGDPLRAIAAHDAVERFWGYVERQESGCWLWRGEITWKGYGRIHLPGRRRQMAHRFAYELLVGPIPDGLTIDHLCRNRSCVNPEHLEPVTARENILRGDTLQAANAAKTHCAAGHEFTPENTYVRPTGGRACRECRRHWSREYQRRRQAELALSR